MSINNTQISKKASLKLIKQRSVVNEFDGTEKVEHSVVQNKDFIIPLEDHVANYNPEILTKDWNINKTAQTLLTKIYRAFMYGLPRA